MAREGEPLGAFATEATNLRALMATTNWSSTALGDMSTWPEALRTIAATCLGSRFPVMVFWGPEFVQIYNDAYAPLIGEKHPRALGQRAEECFPEIWHVIGPMLQSVLATGQATWSNDQMLLLDRSGSLEECYFTYSFGPAGDPIDGVFCAVLETTTRVVLERRLNVLRAISTALAGLRTATEVFEMVVLTLDEHGHDLLGGRLRVADATGQLHNLTWASASASSLGEPMERLIDRALHDGVLVIESMSATDSGDERVLAAIPIHGLGPNVAPATLAADLNPQIPFDAAFRAFLLQIAGAITAALSIASGHELEAERAQVLLHLAELRDEGLERARHHSAQLEALAAAAGQILAKQTLYEIAAVVEHSALEMSGAESASVHIDVIRAPEVSAPSAPREDPREIRIPLEPNDGRHVGTIRLVSRLDTAIAPQDLELVQQLAFVASRRIENITRYRQERSISHTLQRSLLPEELPDLATIDIATRYRPAGAEEDVGGDWYDAMILPDGRLMFSIGDVEGHDLKAAVAMNKIRLLLRAHAGDIAGPGELCYVVNRLLPSMGVEKIATMTLGFIDPRTGDTTLVNAGHPLPLLWSDNSVEVIELPISLPLGVRHDARYQELSTTLGNDATLLLYTDGLIERNGEHLDHSLRRLISQLELIDPLPVETAVDEVLAVVTEHSSSRDDIALLALRRKVVNVN